MACLLTFTDASFADVGHIWAVGGDFAWGVDENDFSVDLSGYALPEVGAAMYLEGTDVGGLVTGFESRSDLGIFSVVGDTWTGVIDRHVLRPDSGQTYWSVSGDVRDCVAALLSRLGMGALFTVAAGATGVEVSHTFMRRTEDATQDGTGRYMGGWAAMWQLLSEHGCKASFSWDPELRKVVVGVSAMRDWSDAESQSAGLAELGVSKRLPTNHLVCLGKELAEEREVVDLYCDASGGVSTTQTYTGLEEIAEVYDDSAHEGDELVANGTSKLKKLWADAQEVTVQATAGVQFDLGDLVGGMDVRSGISATAIVTKKVASLSGGHLSYTYSSTVRG